MEFARHFVDKFADLFRGNTSCYGQHFPEKKKIPKGLKLEGNSATITKTVTQENYLKHLHGEESLGIVPLDHNGNLRFAVIDLDDYDPKRVKVLLTLKILKTSNLPFVAFQSKSGGMHLFLFMSQDTKAALLRPLLKDVVALLGLDPDTEIFPKQTRLVGNQKGSWINLPYFNFSKTVRYAIDCEGKKLQVEEALDLCIASKISVKELTDALDALPLAKAPPCLQTILMQGGADEGFRNVFLFNCATYLKAQFGTEFAEYLHELNTKTEAPVDYKELDMTIISSHNKGDYSYQCNDGYLSQRCNKELCSARKYGKGAGTVSDLSFEQLIQINSSSPYYIWYVNGAKMVFYTESELISQSKFRELCLRLLHKVPNTLKPESWNNILNRALANIKIEAVEAEDDFSDASLWVSKVAEFFAKRKALKASQIDEGLVWLSEHKNDNGDMDSRLYFKGAKLMEFLESSNMFKNFKKARHRNMLDQLGAKKAKLRFPDTGQSVRAWYLNLTSLHKQGLFRNVSKDNDAYETDEPLNFLGKEQY